jgi:hypothetical protein
MIHDRVSNCFTHPKDDSAQIKFFEPEFGPEVSERAGCAFCILVCNTQKILTNDYINHHETGQLLIFLDHASAWQPNFLRAKIFRGSMTSKQKIRFRLVASVDIFQV